jgi:hypothetical protein
MQVIVTETTEVFIRSGQVLTVEESEEFPDHYHILAPYIDEEGDYNYILKSKCEPYRTEKIKRFLENSDSNEL